VDPLTVIGLTGIPEVRAGDDLAALIGEAGDRVGGLVEGDLVVVSSKIVSKALGLWAVGDARGDAVEDQTVRVVAERLSGDRVTQIVQSTAGPVMAAAGVDASNTGGREDVLVLPSEPDAEADRLRVALRERSELTRLGVVVTDTAGRPWRSGQVDFALGAAGVTVVDDLRGRHDADGRPLTVTARALVDELAAAADLVKGKADAIPAAVVRGTPWARGLVRLRPGRGGPRRAGGPSGKQGGTRGRDRLGGSRGAVGAAGPGRRGGVAWARVGGG
jgi:coenzyme F420-0:L-glutamate ligase/coenzyme F420-1:gamma-L-glutamate ligase